MRGIFLWLNFQANLVKLFLGFFFLAKAIHQWFGGKLLIKMKNNKEITVSHTYAKRFKEKVNI